MEKNSPLVYIIVLNYNGKKTLNRCLLSILKSNYSNYQTVLVDNASTDGSLEQAKNGFSKIHFIRNSQNIGFAAGNNIGIRYALEKFADYILILNSDAYLEHNTLSLLIAAAEKEQKATIINPRILKNDGGVWFEGGSILWLKMRAIHAGIQQYSEYATGCAMLVPQKIFEKIGLFDEHFFLYYEDTDFSQRAIKQGFKCKILPDAKIIHDETSKGALENKLYWLVFSGLLFFKKHTVFYLKPLQWIYLAARIMKNRIDLFKSASPVKLAVARAYRDYIYGKATK